MAKDDIVAGVFGLTPEMYQAGQTQRDIAEQQAAQEAANASGGLFAKAYAPQIQQQSQLMGRALGGVFGVEDPQLQMVREVSNIRNQFDITTPEGMQGFAKAIAPKYPQLAMQALDKVAALEELRSKAELRRAQADKALRGPVVSPEQLLSSAKYTPSSVAQYQQTGNIGDLVLVKGAGGEGEAGPGPVGKTGAYRNVYGEIIPASEMSKQRAGFQKAETLLDNLNRITTDDIKNSESWLDWTSGETKKQFGGTVAAQTVQAQARINAAQLLKQIDSLPPGSASNADMASAKSSFPGYGDAKNLEKWVVDTKAQLTDSLARQSEQYGFTQKVTAKPLTAAAKPSSAQSADDLVNKYLPPKKP